MACSDSTYSHIIIMTLFYRLILYHIDQNLPMLIGLNSEKNENYEQGSVSRYHCIRQCLVTSHH